MRKVILTKKNNRYSNRKFSKKNNNKHKQGKYRMFGGSSQENIKNSLSHEEAENFMHNLFSNRKLIKTYNIILAKETGKSILTIIIYYIKIINSIPNRKTFAFQIGDYKFNIYQEVNKYLTKIGHLNGIRPASAPENTIIFNDNNYYLATKHNKTTRLLIENPTQVQKKNFILTNIERHAQRQGQINQLEDPLIPPPFEFSAKGIKQQEADRKAAEQAVEAAAAAKAVAAQGAIAQTENIETVKQQIPLIIYRSNSCSFDTLLSMFHTIDRYSSNLPPIKSLLNDAIRKISTSNIEHFRPHRKNQPQDIPYWKVPIAQAEEEFVEKTLQFIYMLNHILDTLSSGNGINCEGNLRPVVNNILKLINFYSRDSSKNDKVRQNDFGIIYPNQSNNGDSNEGPFSFDLFNNFVNSSFIDIVLLISCFLKIFPRGDTKKIGFELYYNKGEDYNPVNEFQKSSDYTGLEEVIFIPYVANAEAHPPYRPPDMIHKNSYHILIGIILRTPGHYESVNYMDNAWYYYDGRRYNGRAYPLISYDSDNVTENHQLATKKLFQDKGNIGMTVRTLSSVFVYVKTNTTNTTNSN